MIDEDDNLYCDLEDENEVESSNSISNKKSASSSDKLREAWALANQLLDEKLGDLSFLVKKYLEAPPSKSNTMKIPNTAKASLRYGVSPAALQL